MKGISPVNDPLLSIDEKARITKFGKFLRRTRLDEVPQFINILEKELEEFLRKK